MLPLTAFNEDKILQGILDWAAAESPTYDVPSVNQMMDLAEEELREMGASVERLPGLDGFGDVVKGRFGRSGEPGILVLSHLDTVHELGTLESTLPIRVEGDKAYGPGVLDMKGGARLTIEAFKALQDSSTPIKLPVTFMFTPDEEVGSPSSRARIEQEAAKHKYVLVAEPLRPWGDVVTGRHAVQRFFVRCIGTPSHAGLSKQQGNSAIAQMAKTITKIEEMNDYERQTTYAVGTVHGGKFVNVVAETCEAEVLCVAPSDELLEEVRANMAALSLDKEGLKVEVIPSFCRPVAPPHAETMALYDHAKNLAAQLGISFGHCQSAGGSDGNFTGALGVATLDGLGVAGAGAHTHDEHILVPHIVPRCQLLAGLFETLK